MFNEAFFKINVDRGGGGEQNEIQRSRDPNRLRTMMHGCIMLDRQRQTLSNVGKFPVVHCSPDSQGITCRIYDQRTHQPRGPAELTTGWCPFHVRKRRCHMLVSSVCLRKKTGSVEMARVGSAPQKRYCYVKIQVLISHKISSRIIKMLICYNQSLSSHKMLIWSSCGLL